MAGDVTKKSPEMDMSQFRHKRNIKYLEKWHPQTTPTLIQSLFIYTH